MHQVDEWAEAHGLELTPESRPLVSRHLRRARLMRTAGAVAGVLLAFAIDGVGPEDIASVFVGYLVGAL
ncbi:MAG: hypothetical protein ACRDPR_13305, partial [Nocardioidaceae bacterium]